MLIRQGRRLVVDNPGPCQLRAASGQPQPCMATHMMDALVGSTSNHCLAIMLTVQQVTANILLDIGEQRQDPVVCPSKATAPFICQNCCKTVLAQNQSQQDQAVPQGFQHYCGSDCIKAACQVARAFYKIQENGIMVMASSDIHLRQLHCGTLAKR